MINGYSLTGRVLGYDKEKYTAKDGTPRESLSIGVEIKKKTKWGTFETEVIELNGDIKELEDIAAQCGEFKNKMVVITLDIISGSNANGRYTIIKKKEGVDMELAEVHTATAKAA